MAKAQKMAVTNNGGFTMWARAKSTHGVVTPWTDSYPNPQTRVIDLAEYHNVNVGAEVFPVVDAALGHTTSGPHMTYEKNGETAHYEVTGTTLDIHIKLVSS